jgi:hypothetical protein
LRAPQRHCVLEVLWISCTGASTYGGWTADRPCCAERYMAKHPRRFFTRPKGPPRGYNHPAERSRRRSRRYRVLRPPRLSTLFFTECGRAYYGTRRSSSVHDRRTRAGSGIRWAALARWYGASPGLHARCRVVVADRIPGLGGRCSTAACRHARPPARRCQRSSSTGTGPDDLAPALLPVSAIVATCTADDLRRDAWLPIFYMGSTPARSSRPDRRRPGDAFKDTVI